MRFSKYNNPNKKRKPRKKLSRTDADIVASKAMIDDMRLGYNLGLQYYDELSDRLCGKESRHLYDKGE